MPITTPLWDLNLNEDEIKACIDYIVGRRKDQLYDDLHKAQFIMPVNDQNSKEILHYYHNLTMGTSQDKSKSFSFSIWNANAGRTLKGEMDDYLFSTSNIPKLSLVDRFTHTIVISKELMENISSKVKDASDNLPTNVVSIFTNSVKEALK